MKAKTITIPKDEYKFLLHCKEELIRLSEKAVQECHNEMQGQQINGIIQSLP